MQKAIEMLSEVKESIMNAYEIKTGMSRAKISHLMDAERRVNPDGNITAAAVQFIFENLRSNIIVKPTFICDSAVEEQSSLLADAGIFAAGGKEDSDEEVLEMDEQDSEERGNTGADSGENSGISIAFCISAVSPIATVIGLCIISIETGDISTLFPAIAITLAALAAIPSIFTVTLPL